MIGSTVPLGRFAGIPVGAHWSVLVTMALIVELLALRVLGPAAPGHSFGAYLLVGAVTAIVFMASLLVHELTHALVARHFRLRTKRITLWLLGGVAELEGEPPSPLSDALIALAGPLASLAVGALALGSAQVASALGLPVLVVAALVWVGITNVVLAGFNLLPAAPLDGGRVLRAIVWKATGNRERAVSVAVGGGRVIGVLLVGAGLMPLLYGRFDWLPLALVGWFVLASATAESSGGLLKGLRVADVMVPEPTVVPGWWTVRTFLDRIAVSSPHRVFPVVSFDGHPDGLVCLADLNRLTPDDRARTRVDKVCRRLAAVPVAGPDDALDKVAVGTGLRAGRDLVLVVADGRLAGVVSGHDIARAFELRMLGESVVGVSGRGETD